MRASPRGPSRGSGSRVRGSPLESRRFHSSEELLAGGALAVAMLATVVLSSVLALNWSWPIALAAAAAVAGIMVALSRPGLAIGLVLLLFFVLDENTDDVLPVLGRAGDELYGDYIGGLLADRDVLLVICAVLAVVFFPAAEDRRRRVFGSVTWVFIAVGACIVAGLVVGLYALTGPVGSLIGLRPYYTCVLAAFIVWRVLRSMPRERAERAIFWSATVVGIVLIVIGAVRVLGIAGTPVEIEGVPITFFDSASPYALLCCVGVWGVALSERRYRGAPLVGLLLLALAGLTVAIASQRRAILLGYVIAAVALLVLNAVRQRGGFVRSVRVVAGVLLALAAVVLLVSFTVPGARGVFEERASSALTAAEESSSTDPSLQYRVDESDAVYALAGRQLWTGIGPRAGFTPVNSIFLPTDGTYTHNTYLTLPLRYGIWGIMALTVLVIGLVVVLLRGLIPSPPRQAWVMAASLIALLPAIATAAFLTQTARWPIVVGAIAGAFDALTDRPPPEHERAPAPGREPAGAPAP